MLRIGCYTRKSVYSDKSDSTDVQYKLACDYCNSHYNDFEIYRYEDEGYSGANTSRPDYCRLISDIKDNKLDIIICYKIDRIARDVLDFSQFFSLLSEHGLEFVCIKDQIDTNTPLGRAMMYICSVFAQMERETIAERVSDNMIALAKSGKWPGGQAPTGYKLKKITVDGKIHTTLVADKESLSYLNIVSDTFLGGNFSLTGLETYFKNRNFKTLNGKYLSASQIHDMLTHPIYATADQNTLAYFKNLGCIIGCDESKFNGEYGILPYNRTSGGKKKKHTSNPPSKWIISVGLHKPVMSSEKWISIQERFGRNIFEKTRKHKIGLLKGVLRCSCGRMMRTKHKLDKIYNVTYDNYICPVRYTQGAEYCSISAVHISYLDNTVIDLLKSISLDKSIIDNYTYEEDSVSVYVRSREDVQRDIERIELKISNLTSTLSSNSSSAAAKYIVSEIESLDKQIAGLKFELLEIESYEKKCSKLRDRHNDIYKLACEIVDNLETAEYDELNKLINELFKECVWDGESLKIKL